MVKDSRYLKAFPKPLLDDLVTGRWIPIIGAGFSRNAVVTSGEPPSLWSGLARALADDIPDFTYDNPLDAISAYEFEFTRARLVERVVQLLRINDAQPGEAHEAFCKMGFENVVTTNFDLLLEQQYASLNRPCLPLIDEVQLSVPNPYRGPVLIKLHGDVHHPDRLVLTESDYDNFLRRYPLLATHLSSLLITGTAVLIGYSLEDPDMRQLLAIINERLGPMRRPIYALLVSPEPAITARYGRRGVRVIALDGPHSKYGSILAALFTELHEYSVDQVPKVSETTEERVSEGLLLPPDAGRLCYFAVPLRLLSWYKENFFPLVREQGLTPVSADEVISPGEAVLTKIEALIRRSVAIIADVGSRNTVFELGMALSQSLDKQILVIAEEGQAPPFDVRQGQILIRPREPLETAEELIDRFRNWLSNVAPAFTVEAALEPERLLRKREYRAAVISAFSLLEDALTKRLDPEFTPRSFPRLLDAAFRAELLDIDIGTVEQLKEDYLVRSRIVHRVESVSRPTATAIVDRALAILRSLR
jgi:hypothetical protein